MLRCTAVYTGDFRWAPTIEIRDEHDVIYEVSDHSMEGLLDMRLMLVATPEHNGLVFSAVVFFYRYNGVFPDNAATNYPSYRHHHTFYAAIVHCEWW